MKQMIKQVGVIGLGGLALGAAVAVLAQQTPPPMSFNSGGYIAVADLPTRLASDPPPPAPGSPLYERDQAAQKAALALRGSLRWALATQDADLFSPDAVGKTFSCAAGLAIDGKTMPLTIKLLRRAARDFSAATAPMKDKYMRHRPFMDNGQPSCTPDQEAGLRKNGSYPSGHSAIGFGWGLILADMLPAHSAALIERGKQFGDSRRICNVHYRSDVIEGRVIALGVWQKLKMDTAFKADLALAKAEMAAAKHAAAPASCTAEGKVLRAGMM